VDRDINPAIGTIPLTRLRADPLDGLYESLATTGGRAGGGLGPETIHEVHVIIRACIDEAVHTRLVAHIVAHWRRSRTVELANHQPGVTIDANSWTVDGPARPRAARPAAGVARLAIPAAHDNRRQPARTRQPARDEDQPTPQTLADEAPGPHVAGAGRGRGSSLLRL
jgi:hypothetical protein